MTTKRTLSILVALVLLLLPCVCAHAGTAADVNTITMLVGQGNGESYYNSLRDMIREDLGIEVEFVYHISRDTSDATRLYFANNDLPADIVFTASKTDDALLRDSCVDLLGRTSVATLFTQTVINDCTTSDGAIYQLPITTRLIGITYNETLMQEMGWEVPRNFEDMVDLKAKCDEAGVKFAVFDSFATGHGFNWLFHLMGTQYLSTLDGTAWLEGFQSGTKTVDEFKESCGYFQKWTEAGLWGSNHSQDWGGNIEFSQTRALFWFGLTNSMTGYEGPQYDDEGNETGVMLKDTYKSMPWLSEDGSNNCYTTYDSCWVSVNKKLEENPDKLAKVFEILKYIAGERATSLVSQIGKDTYVATTKYEMGEDRLYSAFTDDINSGFVQPWYYNNFDMDSIVYTGEKVNAYLAGTGSFDDIFTTLDEYNRHHLQQDINVLTNFTEKLDYENTAKMTVVSAAVALNTTLAENGMSQQVDVSIVPYATDENPMQPYRAASVSNSVVYAGDFDASMSLVFCPNNAVSPVGVTMTGAEIKALTEKGFDPSDRFVNAETGESTFDSEHYGPYAYAVLVKDGAELADDQEYLVALCESYVSAADYAEMQNSGKVLAELENVHTLDDGLKLFCAEHPTISPSDIMW